MQLLNIYFNLDITVPTKNINQNIDNYNNQFAGVIEIPTINIRQGFKTASIHTELKESDGIRIFDEFSTPSASNGNTILASHNGICNVCYFKNIHKLQVEDNINIYYQESIYSYSVIGIYEVDMNDTSLLTDFYDRKILTLVTCVGNTINPTKRLVVQAEFIKEEKN